MLLSIYLLLTTLFQPIRTVAELFSKAQNSNKPVMLYFHFNECGACRLMEKKAFAEENNIKALNENYLLFSINFSDTVAKKEFSKFNIRLFPTFIVYNSDSSLYNLFIGYYNTEQFKLKIKNSLSADYNYFNLKANRKHLTNKSLYRNYLNAMADAYSFDSLIFNNYFLYANSLGQIDFNEDDSLLVKYCVYQGMPMISSKSMLFNYLFLSRESLYKKFGAESIDSRLIAILNGSIMNPSLSLSSQEIEIFINYLNNFSGIEFIKLTEEERTIGVVFTRELYKSTLTRYFNTSVEFKSEIFRNCLMNKDSANQNDLKEILTNSFPIFNNYNWDKIKVNLLKYIDSHLIISKNCIEQKCFLESN